MAPFRPEPRFGAYPPHSYLYVDCLGCIASLMRVMVVWNALGMLGCSPSPPFPSAPLIIEAYESEIGAGRKPDRSLIASLSPDEQVDLVAFYDSSHWENGGQFTRVVAESCDQLIEPILDVLVAPRCFDVKWSVINLVYEMHWMNCRLAKLRDASDRIEDGLRRHESEEHGSRLVELYRNAVGTRDQ